MLYYTILTSQRVNPGLTAQLLLDNTIYMLKVSMDAVFVFLFL